MNLRPIILTSVPHQALKLGYEDGDPSHAIVQAFSLEVARHLEDRRPLPEINWEVLDLIPRAAKSIKPWMLEMEHVMEQIEVRPAAALFVLGNIWRQPEFFDRFAKKLETTISMNAVVLAQYIAFRNKLEKGLEIENYRERMLVHPMHAVRWAQAMKDEAVGPALLHWAAANATNHAGAAWCVVVANQENPESYRPILATNALYMAAAACTFGMKFAIDELPPEITAQELYTLLRNEACYDVPQTEQLLISRDPFWALEWLLDSDQCRVMKLQQEFLHTLKIWVERGHPSLSYVSRSWSVATGLKKPASSNQGGGDPRQRDIAREAEEDAELGEDESPVFTGDDELKRSLRPNGL